MQYKLPGSQQEFSYNVDTQDEQTSIHLYNLFHVKQNNHTLIYAAMYRRGVLYAEEFYETFPCSSHNASTGHLCPTLDYLKKGDEGLYYMNKLTTLATKILQCTFVFLLGNT